MKKIFLFMVMLITILPLVACNNDNKGNVTSENAYKSFLKVTETMANVKSLDMNLDMVVKSNSTNILMHGTSQQTTDPVEMSILMDIDSMDEKITVKTYYKEGKAYYSMDIPFLGEMKYKMNVDDSELKEMITRSSIDSAQLDFKESDILDSSVKTIDGGKELSFKLDGKAISESSVSMFDSLTSYVEDITKMELSDILYKVIIDNDFNMKSMSMEFDIKTEVDDKPTVMNCDFSATINNLNNVTVTFPDDLDTYVDFNEENFE